MARPFQGWAFLYNEVVSFRLQDRFERTLTANDERRRFPFPALPEDIANQRKLFWMKNLQINGN